MGTNQAAYLYIAYLYAYAGQAYKAQERLWNLMETMCRSHSPFDRRIPKADLRERLRDSPPILHPERGSSAWHTQPAHIAEVYA